ncbi:MAG: hypothetical protein IJS25_04785 [Bacteroidales bacterium]|nr:hypothetical protein [Bacteroidales bacterium]
MPYRRLPNTDAARLRALKNAFTKGTDLSPIRLAFSQETLYELRLLLPKFESAVVSYKKNISLTNNRQHDFPSLMHKTRLYISHFIQVINMCIARGEMPDSVRAYFGLENYGTKIPRLQTGEDLIKWGEIIIKGENERIRSGMHPITNPTAAMVKVKYEQFVSAYYSKNLSRQSHTRMQSDIVALREEVDALILKLWNEIETFFGDMSDDVMRQHAAEYGVCYVFRKEESGYGRALPSGAPIGNAQPVMAAAEPKMQPQAVDMVLF